MNPVRANHQIHPDSVILIAPHLSGQPDRLQKFPQSIQTGGQGWQKTSTIHQKSQKIEINFQGPYKAKIALESTYNLHGYIIQSITTPNDINHWPQPPEQPYFSLKLQRPWVQPSTSPCIANEGQSCVLYSMKTKSWCCDTDIKIICLLQYSNECSWKCSWNSHDTWPIHHKYSTTLTWTTLTGPDPLYLDNWPGSLSSLAHQSRW